MKRLFYCILLCIVSVSMAAQGPFYQAIQKMERHDIPRGSGKSIEGNYKWGSLFWVSEKDYALNIYKDIRLKETYVVKDSPWPDISISCCIPISGSSDYLLYCSTDDSDWTGASLLIVDKNGYVLDSVIVDCYSGKTNLMQWFISSDWKIKVTSLSATEADSFKICSFTWFTGQRTDRTYEIRNGKFVLTGTQKYLAKRYTEELLSREDYDLMKGGETPIR